MAGIQLRACRTLAAELDAEEGILTRHDSPVIYDAFFDRRAAYETALLAEAEVTNLDDLYIKIEDNVWDSKGYWRFLGKNKGKTKGSG
jgi:hypothetical protein